jgi:hypothetical protein
MVPFKAFQFYPVSLPRHQCGLTVRTEGIIVKAGHVAYIYILEVLFGNLTGYLHGCLRGRGEIYLVSRVIGGKVQGYRRIKRGYPPGKLFDLLRGVIQSGNQESGNLNMGAADTELNRLFNRFQTSMTVGTVVFFGKGLKIDVHGIYIGKDRFQGPGVDVPVGYQDVPEPSIPDNR